MYAKGTGGGPSKNSTLTQLQEKVVNLLSIDKCVSGIEGRRFGFPSPGKTRQDESLLNSTQLTSCTPPSLDDMVEVQVDVLDEPELEPKKKRVASENVECAKKKKTVFGLVEEQGLSRDNFQSSVLNHFEQHNNLMGELVAEFRRYNDAHSDRMMLKSSSPIKSVLNMSIEVLDSD